MSTYTQETLPEWVKVGAKVVSVRRHFTGSTIDFEGKIESIGKRDIVVSLSRSPKVFRKYRVRDLRLQGSDHGPTLRDPKGKNVRDIKAERARNLRIADARFSSDFWSRNPNDPEGIVRAIGALVVLLPSNPLKKALKAALAEHGTPKEEKDS